MALSDDPIYEINKVLEELNTNITPKTCQVTVVSAPIKIPEHILQVGDGKVRLEMDWKTFVRMARNEIMHIRHKYQIRPTRHNMHRDDDIKRALIPVSIESKATIVTLHPVQST